VKLIIAIVNDEYAESAINKLIEREYRVTRVASTGGFLRRGNTTLLIGTQDELVDDAFEIIRQVCTEREEPGDRKATVFVLDMARFEQL
jgi:uncharacterized protein YaaQ